MASVRNNEYCCGLYEIVRLSEGDKTPHQHLYDVVSHNLSCYEGKTRVKEGIPNLNAFYLFTGVVDSSTGPKVKEGYGEKFAAYLIDHDFGTVVETPARKNYNSDHILKVWLWTPNHEGIKAWWKDLHAKKLAKAAAKVAKAVTSLIAQVN